MGKENICFYFKEKTCCGFARWLIEKPISFIEIPEEGCGKKNIENCHRITSKNRKTMQEYGPNCQEEFDIALPPKYENSKGENKRLPGGIHI